MDLRTTLLPHQLPGVEKLLPLRIGALYMEMGTGKTRTALEIIKRRLDAGKLQKVLWLCPCSVKGNLAADLDKHATGWRDIIRIDGIESLSGSIRLAGELLDVVNACDKMMLVVDESNLVKNHAAIRSRRIVILAEKCKYRMILNGTPISRNEADLFNQWYVLDWRVLGYRSFFSFAANHLEYDPCIKGKIVRTLDTDYLVRKIAPYSYQVYLCDCYPLPYKYYREISVDLTQKQADHYIDVADAMIEQIDEMQPTTIYRMFTALQNVISGRYVSGFRSTLISRPMFDDPMDNPRIEMLLATIRYYIKGKAIIFCKYTHEIRSILEVLGDDAVPFYGDIPPKQRQQNLAEFRGSKRFLVANKTCAGYGLNLQFCHNVIFYSNDWDYATRVQAEDRVYRIGQDQEVKIYDLVCDGTLDNQIMRCLHGKENMVDHLKSKLQASNDVKETLRSWVRGRGGKIVGEAIQGD